MGECADGGAALDAIRVLRPELVLLDVSMPGPSGLDVAARLEPDERPAIVFVTAYDEYAVQAFEVHAVDYLLKPVREERLREAVQRALDGRVAGDGAARREQLEGLLTDRAHAADADEWIVVRAGQKRVPLRWEEVVSIESAGNYARVHTSGGEYLLRSSLTDLERRLDTLPFARIHRRTLVNVSRIVSMRPIGHGDFRVGGRRRPRAPAEPPLPRRPSNASWASSRDCLRGSLVDVLVEQDRVAVRDRPASRWPGPPWTRPASDVSSTPASFSLR